MTNNENSAETFLTKISTMDPTAVQPFSTYYHSSYDGKYKPFLRKTKFIYTIERKINQNGSEEKETLSKFKNKYCKSIDKYSLVGFDVTYDVINRYIRGGDKLDLSSTTTQLASKFEYMQKKSGGAYYNKGFRLVRMQE